MRVLTNVEPVVDATLALLPVLCLAQVGDAVNVSLQALLWGGGKQKVWGMCTVGWWWADVIYEKTHGSLQISCSIPRCCPRRGC